jgi:hypothetical protein
MADWFGRLMSDWPGWALLLGLIILAIGYLIYMILFSGGDIAIGRRVNLSRKRKAWKNYGKK